MKYCGIDLHWNNSVVLVSDEEDRIVLQKRLPNDLGQIQAALQPHRDELADVVIESTFNWFRGPRQSMTTRPAGACRQRPTS